MIDRIEELRLRTQAGEVTAGSELLAMFYERIFAYFRRLCGSEEDAADLTQKTFAKVWTALGSYQGRASFSTWLHGIAHHVYVDWRRRKNPAELRCDEWWEMQAGDALSPGEEATGRDLACQLYALVEQLDPDIRETVHLHYYQGLSLAETAEVLGIAASTVKYRLRQALDFLRCRMAEPRT